MRARALSLSLALAALILGSTVSAIAAEPDSAKKHFEAGRKLRAEGDCARAIPEFEQSLEAEKSIGAYYNLGYCQEQLGRRPEAYDAYRRARDLASVKKDDRLKEISGALAALMETPNVRLVLPQPLPSGFVLQVDGEIVPPAMFQPEETVVFTKSTPSHTIRASAPGFEDTQLTVESRALTAITMKEAGKPPPPPPPKTAAHTPIHRQPLVLGAAALTGLAMIATGLIVYLKQQQVIDKWEDRATAARQVCGENGTDVSEKVCRSDTNKNVAGRELYMYRAGVYNDRLHQGQDLTLFVEAPLWIVGGLLVGGAAYLFLTRPSESDGKSALRLSPYLGPHEGGGAFSLRF